MKIFNLNMLNCYEATKFISELLDNEKSGIGFLQKFSLFIHLLMCKSCKNYKQQLIELHNSFKSNEINHYLPNVELSKEAEGRIQNFLLNKIKEI